ncbi:MAG: 2-oxoglutarate dehydrogenase complex dihydrolipoyllysine-residue succinyltransferase [Steroidobacteraceae bacterium]|nr:2-oxoglutarate dehydrogenase complex dihydrolipoyllysine-residue succinyltransferase [Steroidobacteraceae bacterium]
MSIEVKVPQLPESVADGTLTQWNKKVGDAVARDEELVSLETDKVMLGVPAPVSGTLVEIRVAGGSTVTSGQVLAVIAEGAVAAAAVPVAVAAEAPPAAEGAKLAPSVRRLVEENKLDPASIAGSGRDGRITKGDVVQHLATPAPAAAPPAAPATRPAATAAIAPAAPRGGRVDQRVPMTRLRARIAQRLVEAQATQALLTTFNEVDMTALNGLRARYKESFEKKYGVRLGFMSFYVKACTEALKRFPMVNASVEGNDIVYHEFYDVGVAVSTDRGLIVPVLRDADLMSCADIERAVVGYAQRAREGSITLEELTGGTFSITNGGVFGSLLSTPIVNAPQSAILGMHKVQDRPVAVNGQVVIRPMMYLALTYDHRIIDGREAVQFLVAVKDAIEDPARLLLQV